MSWYYRCETKGIQRWIMSTPRLRELRGGSQAIEAATDAARGRLESLGATIHQAAAGAIACVFKSREDLESFASVWPAEASRLLPGLQVIQAWKEIPGGGEDVGDKTRTAVYADLGARRNLPMPPSPEIGPLVARNARTGLPAVGTSRAPGGRLLTDEATALKERAQKEARSKWDEVSGRRLGLDENYEGLIAVIHADGTGVGNRLIGVQPKDLQRFSTQLEAASVKALEHAISEAAKEAGVPDGGALHMQVVVAGGDDLTVICRADLALPLTKAWLQRFEELTAELPGTVPAGGFKGLRAGAGIAWSSYRHPFYKAYELAEELAKIAKRAGKVTIDGKPVPVDSVIAMRRITTSFDDPTSNQGVWRLGVNEGPESSLPAISALKTLSDATRTLGRGGLRQWLTAFEEGVRLDNFTEANRLLDRIHEVQSESAMKVFNAALTAANARRDTASGAGGAFSGAAPDLTTWTPIRDALLLNTIARRTEKTDA